MLLRALERLVRNRDDGDARRQGDALLHAGEADVEAPAVELDRDAAERRDRVDEHERVGSFLADDRAQRGHVVGHAGRRLVVRDRHRVVVRALMAREMIGERVGIDGVAPAGIEAIDFVAEGFGDVVPALGERAAGRDEHAPGDAVLERRLHHARAGGRSRRTSICVVSKSVFRSRVDAAEQLFELGAAVADHRPRHLLQDLGTDPRRAGDEVFGGLGHDSRCRYGSTAVSVGSVHVHLCILPDSRPRVNSSESDEEIDDRLRLQIADAVADERGLAFRAGEDRRAPPAPCRRYG